jgi:chromosome segregation ATPase
MAPTGKENDSDNTPARKTRVTATQKTVKSDKSKPTKDATPAVSVLLRNHSALQDQHATLQDQHATLQDKYATLKGEHATLQKGHEKLQNNLGKLELQNGKFKQDIDKRKAKISELSLTLKTANLQIEDLGGGIKVARLTKENEKYAFEKTVRAAEKEILLQSNKAISYENANLKKQLLQQSICSSGINR